MDVLANRYSNFKSFCNQILPDNEFVKVLQSTPLDLFLQTIKSKHDEKKTVDQICELIFEKAKIDKTSLKELDVQKFTRYVTYFHEVLQSLS